MNIASFHDLINNAALLLALGLVYDLLALRQWTQRLYLQRVLTGVALGSIGMAVMFSPWTLATGVVFDTRSVLLSVSGLFFGTIPTLVAMLMTAALRIYQGGAGALTGTTVVLVTGAIGIAWRRIRYNRPSDLQYISYGELYIFGVLVHVAMLLCMLLLPWPLPLQVLSQITLPVMVIYPVAVMLLGVLLASRLKREQVQLALRASEARYRTTLTSVGDAVIAVDATGRVEFLNPVAEALCGWQQADALGKPLTEVFHIVNEETRQPVESPAAVVLRSGGVVGLANHTLLLARDGSEYPIADSGAPIHSDEDEVIGVVLVFRDQSQERAALRAIQESEARYRGLFENMIEGFAYCQMLYEDGEAQDFIYLSVNHAFETLTGLKDVAGKRVSQLIPGIRQSDSELFDIYSRVALGGKSEKFEMFVRALEMWFSVSVYSPKREYFVAVFDVITERKQAEQLVKDALREKEILLRELYHRTKNNMQVIRAMLVLQSANSGSEEVKQLVQATDHKIQAMALVHQMLYQSKNLSSIDLQIYITDLAYLMLGSFQFTPDQIELRLDLQPVQVSLDIATPLGLILNELLSNAFKHAFPDGRRGTVQVSLRRTEAGNIHLEFTDDGVGVLPGFDLRHQPSFGLQSVFSLAEQQLGGKVQVGPNLDGPEPHGLSYSIEFPDSVYPQQV